MSLGDFLQVLISGISKGSIYTLMAQGLLITYLTTRALNFGQGDFLMLASFLAMAALVAGWPVWLSVLAVIVAMGLLGAVIERVAVAPLARQRIGSAGSLAWILTTMGFGMLIQNTAELVWGKSSMYSPPLFSTQKQQIVRIGEAGFYLEELAVAVLALLIVAAFYWLLFRARWGKEVAAVAFDKDTAALLGIDVRRTVVLSYVIMSMLAAASGILAGPVTTVQVHMGIVFIIKGFAVISIGGFANPLGILIAGIGFGLLESFSNYFDSGFGDLYPFLAAVLLLIIRPSGLFGEHQADVR